MTLFWSVEDTARRLPDSVAKLRYLRHATPTQDRTSRWAILLAAAASVTFISPPAKPHGAPVASYKTQSSPLPVGVFLVERKTSGELYSNGLEIRTTFETDASPRHYRRFDRSDPGRSELATKPAGIVFHTTESLVLPIEPGQVRALSRTGRDVLDHVRRGRLYNFVIDRFGQVFRVVSVDETAFHAGHSIWADSGSVYIDLNESFVGVAFEMKAGETPSRAQRHAGKLLTEFLRATYQIVDGNCVTHAQVSVNPDNYRIGYHTDWGSNFPFEELGLASGYSSAVPAVELFGFTYDKQFLEAVGGRPWEGLLAAEQELLIHAAARSILSSHYRKTLQQRYQTLRRQHEKLE